LVGLAMSWLVVGCQWIQTGSPKDKDTSPRSETGLRPERGFRKSPNKPPTPAQAAVFTFLDEDKQRFQAATAELTKLAKPSAVTAALTKYGEQLDAADKSALPAEFQEVLISYRESYRTLVQVLSRLPDGSFEGTKFYEGLAGLFRGNLDAGKFLGGDVVEAVRAARDSATTVYKAAAQFALDVEQ
jgi:hypothetical protein